MPHETPQDPDANPVKSAIRENVVDIDRAHTFR
jgi:hypothetical protein